MIAASGRWRMSNTIRQGCTVSDCTPCNYRLEGYWRGAERRELRGIESSSKRLSSNLPLLIGTIGRILGMDLEPQSSAQPER